MNTSSPSRKILLLFLVVLLAGAPLVTFAALDKLVALAVAVKSAIEDVIILVFALAIVVFGWGIVKYLTAAGDAAKLKAARVFLWWGVLGMFVLAFMYGLILF